MIYSYEPAEENPWKELQSGLCGRQADICPNTELCGRKLIFLLYAKLLTLQPK
jgi:hypothetical protein